MTDNLGALGEQAALDLLVRLGYRLVTRNYHSRYGEIDLIVENDTHLVFVEVKTRTEGALVTSREAITAQKRRRIRNTALCYLSEHETALQPRFDAVLVTASDTHPPHIHTMEHLVHIMEDEA